MWMCYVKEIEVTDLKSGIEYVSQTLSNLAFDAGHEAVYGMGRFYSMGECLELEDRYHQGDGLCVKYLDGEISLMELATKLKSLDLHRFLARLQEFLPQEIKDTYPDIVSTDDDDEDEDSEGRGQTDESSSQNDEAKN